MTVTVSPLTNRRYERFCREYLIDENITAAYERCGYQKDPGNANRLFSTMAIQIRIAQLKHEVHHKLGSTAELVVEGLARIAYADIRDFYLTNPDGTRGELKPIDQWTTDMAMAVQEFELCPVSGRLEKVKLAPRRGALQDLGKSHNIFDDHERAGSGEINITISDKDAQL
jgi:phage terminase small subunit